MKHDTTLHKKIHSRTRITPPTFFLLLGIPERDNDIFLPHGYCDSFFFREGGGGVA